jgi:hypothetical protein
METENKDYDAFKQLQKALKILSERLIEQFKVFPDELKRLQETQKILNEQFEEIKKAIQLSISPNLEKVLKELPHKIKQVYLELAKRGWFLDLDVDPKETLQLNELLTNCSVEEVEEALIARFNSRLSEIKQSIIEKYPRRKKIVEAAFNAHHREEYELSIPVLLAQADGICKEEIKENIFKKEGKEKVGSYLNGIDSEDIIAAILSPLEEKSLPIWISEKKRLDDFNGLNRHMVLHGESSNYGTKTNSLKAISFINYVAEVFSGGMV